MEIILTEEEYKAFVKELEKPPEYNSNLAKALKRPLVFEKTCTNVNFCSGYQSKHCYKCEYYK